MRIVFHQSRFEPRDLLLVLHLSLHELLLQLLALYSIVCLLRRARCGQQLVILILQHFQACCQLKDLLVLHLQDFMNVALLEHYFSICLYLLDQFHFAVFHLLQLFP